MSNFWLGDTMKVRLHIGCITIKDPKMVVFSNIFSYCKQINAQIVYLGSAISELLGDKISELPCDVKSHDMLQDYVTYIIATHEYKPQKSIILEIQGLK